MVMEILRRGERCSRLKALSAVTFLLLPVGVFPDAQIIALVICVGSIAVVVGRGRVKDTAAVIEKRGK
jgi:hypothetical protein